MPDVLVRQRNNILWIILNHPPQNVLSLPMLEQLTVALDKAAQSPPQLLVMTGAGEEAFCSGIIPNLQQKRHQTGLEHMLGVLKETFAAVHKRRIATVSLVKGKASGVGCELMLFCSTIIAREDACFVIPAKHDALFPDATAQALTAFMGKAEAERMLQQGGTLNAREAMHKGLVHQLLPIRRFVQDTEELLVMLAATAVAPQSE
ncbi:MAG TPA: enoyl-CoA hydratase/isomerase family protein [Dictyobacter sp.]|jgi:enoyl-CoA hydratase/carnithine racemase|nr:enoyl-CoA hydratase/isomerase family protein [Dictyobacter sp.]